MKTFKAIAPLLLLLLTTSSLHAQSHRKATIKEQLSLSGNVKYLVLFVETLDQSWEEGELDYYIDEYYNATDWIVNAASEHDVAVTFNDDFKDNFEVVRVTLDNNKRYGSKTILQSVLEKLNYRHLDGFKRYNQVDLDRQRDKMKVLLFWKNNSRSHAYNNSSLDDVDVAVVYCRGTYGMRTDKYVIIHEMLHQFDAWDLYYEHGRSQTIGSAKKAKELWPHSVMINTYRNKELLEVDDLTSWRIGWTDYEPVYSEFNPVTNRKKSKDEINHKKTVWKFDFGKKKKKDDGNEKKIKLPW